MNKGNVLVIGNSGVGKSTLINAVLGEERAETSWGKEGTTKELKLYENENIPFRVIDTIGFEPAFIKQHQAVNAVKKWSKESVGKEEEKQINVIWFCVDGTAGKLFEEAIKNLSRATAMWETVPVVVVITKSFSIPDRTRNIEMVNNAFAKQKKYSKNLRKVIPVVAEKYVLNDTAYAPPEGITELIDITNDLLPDGIKAAKKDIEKVKLNRKRAMAQSIVGVATTAGVVVGAIPIPFADAAILAPTEMLEIESIAKVYGIQKNSQSKQLFANIVEVGAAGAAAKAAISALKAIPAINLAADVLNAIIAGVFVSLIGEGSIYVFEQIYLGNKTIEDIDWVTKVMESKISTDFVKKVNEISKKINNSTDKKEIGKIIINVFKEKK